MKTLCTTLCASILLAGCGTTQLTSGAEYLSRAQATASETAYGSGGVIDAEIAAIAAVEPNLVFPARIGIAYVDRGQLVAMPTSHLQAWEPLLDRIQPDYGEVIPISPLIAGMVSRPSDRRDRVDTVDTIRRGAARQHVDYTLIYEVTATQSESDRNALSIADLSIIGLFVLPSRSQQVEATASAVFLDVRNGYPYGTASGVATKDGLSTVSGSNSRKRKLGNRAEHAAVDALALDAATMFDSLIAQTVARKTQIAEPVTVSP